MRLNARLLLPKAALAAIQLSAVIYYARLLLHNNAGVHYPRTFGDTWQYVREATLPVFSAAFWTQTKPGLTALVYKLVGPDQRAIWSFQLWLTIVCWVILALAVAHAVRSYYLKPIAFVLVLAFSLSRDVFMWIPFIGSEAIAFSSLALFIASAIWLLTDWRNWKIPFLILTAFLTVFSRDTFTLVLLLIALLVTPLLAFRGRRVQLVIIIGSFLAIAAAGTLTAKAGQRFEHDVFPLVTGLRIFPNPEYTKYFESQGMPVDPALVKLSDPTQPGWRKWAVSQALLVQPDQQPWRDWVRLHGVATYIKFLWRFKQDTLQNMFVTSGGSDSFFPNVYYYTATGYEPIIRNAQLAEWLYPTRFGLLFFFLANFTAALVCGFAILLRQKLWLVPLMMVLLTYPQAFLVWNADANDIPRHSIAHNITERLGFWILVLFILDYLAQLWMPRLVGALRRVLSRIPAVWPRRAPEAATFRDSPPTE